MSEYSREIANTILGQLGGRKFMGLVLVENLTYGGGTEKERDCWITFAIGSNSKGMTHVKISLDSNDTYTMTFSTADLLAPPDNPVNPDTTTIVFDDVYCDMLQDLFEENTGFDLSPARVHFG